MLHWFYFGACTNLWNIFFICRNINHVFMTQIWTWSFIIVCRIWCFSKIVQWFLNYVKIHNAAQKKKPSIFILVRWIHLVDNVFIDGRYYFHLFPYSDLVFIWFFVDTEAKFTRRWGWMSQRNNWNLFFFHHRL